MTPAARYQTGKAAEEHVARLYAREGCSILARRWRGPAGELDLVVQQGEEVIFVEVKASRDFSQAAMHLTTRQIQRIYASAAHFLGFMAEGQRTPTRFDVALVDRTGRVNRIANAIGI
ncbi:MAG: YraN family protein [Pseudomonadota bacterium]